MSWSDVEKNTRRCRWKQSHIKIRADGEFGLAMQPKDSWRACFYCIRKPGENQIWKSNTSERSNQERWDLWWALVHQTTPNGILTRSGLLKKWKSDEMLEARTGRPVQHHKWQRQRSWISCPDYQDRTTSSWRSICLYPGKFGRCSKIIENSQKWNVQTFGFVYHDTKGQNHGPDTVVPLERNLYGHPLAGLLWERQFEKILLPHGWEKVSNCECFFVLRENGLFLSVYVDDIKLAGKKQNIDPMWRYSIEKLIWENQHLSFDHENLGCTQRQCEIRKEIVDNYRTMNPEFPQEQLKKYHARKIWVSLRGPMTWKVMPRNVWRDIVNWRTRRLNISTKYLLHALMTIISKKKNWNPRELSKVCSQIVLKCLYVARLGRPDILWELNKIARSIRKWTKACDNDYLAWLLTIPWDFFRFWIVWGVERTSRWFGHKSPGASWLWYVFPRTATIRSHKSSFRGYHPTSILRSRKWFLILLNCLKLKFVSYTSNWLERMYDFKKCTMFHLTISCNNGVLKQSQSKLFCSVSDMTNVVCNHMCDGKGPKEIIVCHMLWSIFVIDRANLFTDHKISSLPIRAKYKHFKTIWEHTFGNSPACHCETARLWRTSSSTPYQHTLK